MGYYDDEKNVADYITMAEGYDGRLLVDVLRKYLPAGVRVLELGMGPGKDLLLLAEDYTVTGSDSSPVFVERYRKGQPDADVLQLDAVTIDTDRHFDGIYSNKVLHHLTREQLATSFQRQAAVLNNGGILLHSFWYGDKEEVYSGLRFVYYTEATLKELIGDAYEMMEHECYAEMDENDSFYVILRKVI